MNKMKKKIPTLDKYIIFCFVVLILYTIVHVAMFWITGGIEMTTIATLVYSAFGGEVLICALIKRLKLKNEHREKIKTMEVARDENISGVVG